MPTYIVTIGPVSETIESDLPTADTVREAIESGVLSTNYSAVGLHADVTEA